MLLSLSPTELTCVDRSHQATNLAKQPLIKLIESNQHLPLVLDALFKSFARKSQLDVVIANHSIRYLVLPALPRFTKKNIIEQYARHAFKEAFGELVNDWLIVINPINHGKTVLACACPKVLIKILMSNSQQHQLKLNQIQPYLMAGFNLIRKKNRHHATCLVQLESTGVLIALIAGDSWERVSFFKTPFSDESVLIEIIEREMLLANWNTQPMTVFSMGLNSAQKLNVASWHHVPVFPKLSHYKSNHLKPATLMALSGDA